MVSFEYIILMADFFFQGQGRYKQQADPAQLIHFVITGECP